MKSQSPLTSLRTKCYDPAGVGCYFFNGLLTGGLRPGPGVEEFQPVKPLRTGGGDIDRLCRVGTGESVGVVGERIGRPVPQYQVRAAKDQTTLANRKVCYNQLVAAIERGELADSH